MKKIVIIGGGILGSSVAYHAAKKGLEVVLIDRQHEGQATDAAAGIVCPWNSQRRNKMWYALARNGARYYKTLIDMLGQDGEKETGYEVVGAVSLQQDEKKRIKMIERTVKRREDAPEIGDVSDRTADETATLFPLLDPVYESVYIGGAARVDGRALRNALQNGARKLGATIIKAEAALSRQGSSMAVRVDGNPVVFDELVVTTGAWTQDVMREAGFEIGGHFQKAQIAHMNVREDTKKWPVVMPPNDQYLVPFPDGKIVLGATHEDNTGFDLRITAGGMNELLTKNLAVAPGLETAEWTETRVGFRPFMPGFLPMFGRLPGLSAVWLANGLGASGLTVGPYLGFELVNMITGQPTDIEPSFYSLDDHFRPLA